MRPRKAGEYARQRYRRELLMWAFAISFGLIAGAATVYILGGLDLMTFLILSAFALACPPLFMKKDWQGSKAWRTGARGEESVGMLLRSLEAEGYVVLHDVPAAKGNIDHVVLGPTGVFAIETKAWSGSVYAAKGTLMRNGFDQSARVGQAMAEAMEINRRLKLVGITAWVEAVIALPTISLPKGSMTFRKVQVMEASNLPEFIRRPRRGLTIEQIVRARAVILRGDEPVSVRSISFE